MAFVVLGKPLDMGLPFLKAREKRRDQILSVDLGGRTTKAVYLERKGDRFHLSNYAIIDTPGYENSGATLPPEQLTEHLKEVVRQVGGRSKMLTLAIGGTDTIFRQVDMPFMPADDMRQMLKFNSKNYLQQDLKDYVFDCAYHISPRAASEPGAAKQGIGHKQRAVVGGVKEKFLNTLQDSIRNAGLLPDQVVPSVIGPINAFELALPQVYAAEVVALVDIGFKNTSVTVLDRGDICLNRIVALGGDRLTTGLAETMGISYKESENIKQGMTEEVRESLDMVINPLGRELRASIDFFEHHNDKTVTEVYVSGGTAANDTILEILQGELMVACKRWDPTPYFDLRLPPEKRGEIDTSASQLATALGVAAAGF